MKTLVNPSETGWYLGRHKGCQSLDLEDSIGIGPEVAMTMAVPFQSLPAGGQH